MIGAIFGNLAFLTLLFLLHRYKVKRLKAMINAERTKGELVGRKEFFENLLNSIPDPIFVKNESHQWIYGNSAFSKLINLELGDYIGKSDHDIFPKEMADHFWQADDETMKNLIEIEYEEFILSNHEMRTSLTKKTPFLGTDGTTILIGVIRDITERKTHEETIRNLFRMIESSSDLYCICDLKGKPNFLNRHGLELGLTPHLDHFTDFLSEDFDLKAVELALQLHHQWEGEVLLLNLETKESIPYGVKLFHVLDEHDRPKTLSLVGTNIKIKKESELKMLFTSKMASLGEMAGGIAHEINNPLAIISGKSEQLKKMIERKQMDPEIFKEGIEKIELTAYRISKIIRGLQSFSRAGDLDPMKEVELNELIEDTLALCQLRMKDESIHLILKTHNELRLRCRPTQIQQVLINLLNNSIDAIKGTKDPWIEIETIKDGPFIRLKVMDSGKGIAAPLQDKIMTPFFTTKDIGKGTGLGLSISRGIMETHEGTLSYNPASPHTTFELTFNT